MYIDSLLFATCSALKLIEWARRSRSRAGAGNASQCDVKDRPLMAIHRKGKRPNARQQHEAAVNWVSTRTCRFSLDQLVEARRIDARPPFSALRLFSFASRSAFSRHDVERVMDTIERAVPAPQAEVIARFRGGRSLGRARHWQPVPRMYKPVDHLAQIDRPLAAAALARRDQRPDQRPFIVGQVARIAQLVAVVARVFQRSTSGTSRGQSVPRRNHTRFLRFKRPTAQPIRSTHKVPGRTLRG